MSENYMLTLRSVLDHILARPLMYTGNDKTFSSVVKFIDGFTFGVSYAMGQSKDAFAHEFSEFLAKKYNKGKNVAWSSILEFQFPHHGNKALLRQLSTELEEFWGQRSV